MRSPIPLALLGLASLLASVAPALAQQPAREAGGRLATVGMLGRLEVALPGPELVARPLDDWATPVVLRVVSVVSQGDGHRYTLEFYGTVPGQHDLRDYLQRADGQPIGDDVPAVRVTVRPAYAQDDPRTVSAPEAAPLPRLGGYRAAAIAAGALWFVGLLAILLVGRGRRDDARVAAGASGPSLADRLRPLVARAARGELDADGQAELERLLVDHWRHRAGLEDLSMAESLARLRSHADFPEAGELLTALERWLHQPPGRGAEVDVAALLAPYERASASGGTA